MQSELMDTSEEIIVRPKPTLDMAGHFPYRLINEGGRTLLELDLSKATRKYFVGHLHELTHLQVNGQTITPMQNVQRAWIDKKLHFPLPSLSVGTELHLRMNNQPVTTLIAEAGGQLVPAEAHTLQQLAGSETRAYGRRLRRSTDPKRDVLGKLPYDRAVRAGFDRNIHAPITDVHTHSSAQIGGAALLAAAMEEDLRGADPIAYPVELLKLLGVAPDKNQHLVETEGRDFNPMREEGLACEQRGRKCKAVRVSELTDRQKQAIITKMDLPPDGTMGFSDFDREMYRYRNPFVKHPNLAKTIIKKMAEEYARMGIEYAELSTGSMMDPKWFAQMVEAIQEIERDGVGPEHKKPVLRFLVGLPRNASAQQTMIDLEKVKFLARHPYIVGVDLLGYESNKTSDFHWALAHMAQWARDREGSDLTHTGWDFKRDFIIRVHAGETGKNPANVSDAIHIAHDFGVRVRVGHALNYDLDGTTRRMLNELNATRGLKGLANHDQFATERCMDSNQVYRTKTLVHNQTRPLDAPCFLGSDGGGAIGTGPVQLAYSALAAGWSLDQLKEQRDFESGYIDRQTQREAMKNQAFESHYGVGNKGLKNFLTQFQEQTSRIPPPANRPTALANEPRNTYLPEQFQGKRPILIGGASGNSWKGMDRADKDQITRITEFLVRACDPKKVYFVLGRVQKEGVSRALDIAVKKYNTEHPREKFAVLGRYAGGGNRPSGEMPETVSYLHDIPQGRDYVPASMLTFTREQEGRAVFFQGSDYTAEMAYGAPDHHIPFAVHEPRKDRMAEVCEDVETSSQFRDFDQFIANVFKKTGPDHFFRSDEDRNNVLLPGISINQVAEEIKAMRLDRETGRGKGTGDA